MTQTMARSIGKRDEICGTFASSDGAELFYRHWPAAGASNGAVVLLHRGHEHSGRFAELVEELALPDCHIFAWDARGHGRSPGQRGYAASFATVVRDLDFFMRFIQRDFQIPVNQTVLLAHSVGAVTAAAWVHDYAPPIRAMILVTPALRVKLYIPPALPALRLRNRFGKSFIKSYVKAKMLTHDAQQAKRYESDELISSSIATNILLEMHDTATRLIADAPAITTPTLILSAGSDWVVKNSAQKKFFDRLGSAVKERVIFDGFYHAVLHEKDRARPIGIIQRFIAETFASPAETRPLIDADRGGYTKAEFDRLSRPLIFGTPAWWNFAAQKAGLKTFGRLSRGIRLGWNTGFDSGQTLDYVYRNQSQGILLLGKIIDWFYLNSVGWRGIRARKIHLTQALREAIEQTTAAGESARAVDIAAGAGRYVLDVLKDLGPAKNVSALCRDRSTAALEVGRDSAKQMGLDNVQFAQGDAFDEQSLATLQPRPNIAVVSGLYELFPDNSMIRRSLSGLAAALPAGAYLIYTNQPWHPQIEMIARVLTNRDGNPWIMRRRTQAEMDQLVAAAGFSKVDMRIDPDGIFTVSIARRTPEATR